MVTPRSLRGLGDLIDTNRKFRDSVGGDLVLHRVPDIADDDGGLFRIPLDRFVNDSWWRFPAERHRSASRVKNEIRSLRKCTIGKQKTEKKENEEIFFHRDYRPR